MQQDILGDSLVKALPTNVHIGLQMPVQSVTVTGDYAYFHYGCDGLDDRGWGCGYRTVQTMASWLWYNCALTKGRHVSAPSLPGMQRALVSTGDKPGHFCGSRDWIGTFEASVVLDHFYDVPCKIVHVRGGGADTEHAVAQLREHFSRHGGPVMMGGGTDNASKGVLGLSTGQHGTSLLIADPHYHGPERDRAELQRRDWVRWTDVSSLDNSSFYNICMPQTNGLLRTLTHTARE
ncbi:ufm1-specific protease 1 [Eucyclogobius newberryi]|uniref:ufm1-specific protease 1-like n=1 Tax=Eucyclogobius newberryi TaxID=166745 RepID=UPI003B59E7CE